MERLLQIEQQQLPDNEVEETRSRTRVKGSPLH